MANVRWPSGVPVGIAIPIWTLCFILPEMSMHLAVVACQEKCLAGAERFELSVAGLESAGLAANRRPYIGLPAGIRTQNEVSLDTDFESAVFAVLLRAETWWKRIDSNDRSPEGTPDLQSGAIAAMRRFQTLSADYILPKHADRRRGIIRDTARRTWRRWRGSNALVLFRYGSLANCWATDCPSSPDIGGSGIESNLQGSFRRPTVFKTVPVATSVCASVKLSKNFGGRRRTLVG